MNTQYVIGFIMALGLSLGLTPLVRALSFRVGLVDEPDSKRKLHLVPVPRIGGLAIAVAWLVPFLFYIHLSRQFIGLLAGILILLALGLYDDIKGLSASRKLAGQVIAAIVVLGGGIGIVYLTNPLGGVVALDGWRIPVELGSVRFNILPIANLVSIIWIVGMINTVNFLDGLDGLASGVASIAALVLFVMALTPIIGNPTVALLAIILLGSLLGFLPYNFFPSSIFMGDSGAYVVGLILALLSIYSGSKIAVGILVLGVAIIDSIWTVLRRLWNKQSPFKADRTHLHHRLLDSGLLSHRQVVLLLYLLTILIALGLLLWSGVAAFALLVLLVVGIISVLRFLQAQSWA